MRDRIVGSIFNLTRECPAAHSGDTAGLLAGARARSPSKAAVIVSASSLSPPATNFFPCIILRLDKECATNEFVIRGAAKLVNVQYVQALLLLPNSS